MELKKPFRVFPLSTHSLLIQDCRSHSKRSGHSCRESPPGIRDAFSLVEQALRKTFIPDQFQGLGEGTPGRGVTRLTVRKAGLALPDTTKTSPEKWTAPYVITGHLVAALRGQEEFQTTDQSTCLRGGKDGGVEAGRPASGGGPGRDLSGSPGPRKPSTAMGNKDGGMAHSAAVHSKWYETVCAGMARFPIPVIWTRAPQTSLISVTSTTPLFRSAMPLTVSRAALSQRVTTRSMTGSRTWPGKLSPPLTFATIPLSSQVAPLRGQRKIRPGPNPQQSKPPCHH